MSMDWTGLLAVQRTRLTHGHVLSLYLGICDRVQSKLVRLGMRSQDLKKNIAYVVMANIVRISKK